MCRRFLWKTSMKACMTPSCCQTVYMWLTNNNNQDKYWHISTSNHLYIIHAKLLAKSCASEAGRKPTFQAVSALVKMQASQSPCTLPSQWPSAAFLTYLHMELWELCFNSLFHLRSVYIMWAYFFKKGKKKNKKIKKTQTSHLYDNDAQSWENTPNFFPFFLDALLIVFQLTFFTGHRKHCDKKLYRFTVVWRDNQTWVTKNNIHCSDRSRSKTRLPVEPTYC